MFLCCIKAGLAAAAAAPPMEGIGELPDGDAELAAAAEVIKDPPAPYAVGDMVVLHGDASDEAQHGPLELATVPGSLPGQVVDIGRGRGVGDVTGEAELTKVRAADGTIWMYAVHDLTLAPDPHRKARDSIDYAEAAVKGKARASFDRRKSDAEEAEVGKGALALFLDRGRSIVLSAPRRTVPSLRDQLFCRHFGPTFLLGPGGGGFCTEVAIRDEPPDEGEAGLTRCLFPAMMCSFWWVVVRHGRSRGRPKASGSTSRTPGRHRRGGPPTEGRRTFTHPTRCWRSSARSRRRRIHRGKPWR